MSNIEHITPEPIKSKNVISPNHQEPPFKSEQNFNDFLEQQYLERKEEKRNLSSDNYGYTSPEDEDWAGEKDQDRDW